MDFIMKNIALTTCLFLIAPATLAHSDIDSFKQEAKAKVKSFAKDLKGTLKGAIKSGGLEQGIQACKVAAPAIASQHEDEQWIIGRISLKNRNPNHAANEWQADILKQFDAKAAQGQNIEKLAAVKVFKEEKTTKYHFIKAIPTQKLCLKCHGEQINDKVATAIDALYPEDKAKGYKVGQVRGAFVLTKTVNH